MKIKITDNRKIADLQKEFNSSYPYLKIEFFSQPHRAGTPNVKKTIQPASFTVGQCRHIHLDGEIIVEAGMTVKDLEQVFIRQYGLFAQVFRKSGKVWLETTVTDSWTLEEQNRQGEALSHVGYEKQDDGLPMPD
jgi:hypothetical protein